MASKEDSLKAFEKADESLRQGIQAGVNALRDAGIPDEDISRYLTRSSFNYVDLACHHQCCVV